MTLHAAKGLEFPVVAMIGLEEGILPHSRAANSPDELEEERRLCFVGITRAEERLILSKAAYRTIRGLRERTVTSPFLNEMPADDLRRRSTAPASTRSTTAMQRDAMPATERAASWRAASARASSSATRPSASAASPKSPTWASTPAPSSSSTPPAEKPSSSSTHGWSRWGEPVPGTLSAERCRFYHRGHREHGDHKDGRQCIGSLALRISGVNLGNDSVHNAFRNRDEREHDAYDADAGPAECGPGPGPGERTGGAAYEKQAHVRAVHAAVELGGETVNPGLVGDMVRLRRGVEKNDADHQPPSAAPALQKMKNDSSITPAAAVMIARGEIRSESRPTSGAISGRRAHQSEQSGRLFAVMKRRRLKPEDQSRPATA